MTTINSENKKTFSNQQNLPHLPVLDLQSTCDNFIQWVQPLLDAEQFQQTKQVVADFQKPDGAGEKLQQALVAWSERPGVTSWLKPFWDSMYLQYRPPITINVSYGLLFMEDPILTQVERAARIINSILKFKLMLDQEALEPELERTTPLCMAQYKHLFSTTRIPKSGEDELRNLYPATANHIIVLHKTHIFSLDVISESGKRHRLTDLEQGLQKIKQMAADLAEDEAVGILTTLPRDEWADVRAHLIAHPQNQSALETIETALFAICLDETDSDNLVDLTKTMLHSDGRNRWFDKSLQFIICQNGQAGMNGEHTGHDATTSLGLVNFIRQDSHLATDDDGESAVNEPQKLQFHLDDPLKQTITKATQGFQALVDDTQTEVLIFAEFGKEQIKQLKVSPDTFVQIALQLAQYKLFGRCYSTYESVMTRQFLHGRTEAMRSVTPEVVQFAKNMTATDCDRETKLDSFQQAAQAHRNRILACKGGQGVQRHIYGLLKIYQQQGAELGLDSEPALFSDVGWQALGHDTLSTSNGSSDALMLFSFGPVVDDGFGIGYIIKKESLHFNITSRTALTDSLKQFVAYLNESLLEMASLLRSA